MPDVKIFLASALWYLASGCVAAHAGAWTQAKGKGQFILTQSAYGTDHYYNNQKKTRPQLPYRKYELNPYLEYGVWDGITLGGNVSLQHVRQRLADGSQHSQGIGDSEFFARLRLLEQNGFAVSAEPLVKLPSPSSPDTTPKLGASRPDAGLGLSAGYGFGGSGRPHFADLYLGYRWRLGDPRDQMRMTATFGYSLTPRWMVMPQIFVTKRRNSPKTSAITLSSGDDYDLGKAQLSALYRMNEKTSLQGGVFLHAAGKNTGAGGGLLISVWRNF